MKKPLIPAVGPRPQYPIESVDNALRVLLLLGERDEVRPKEIAQYLGVATSTAHRLLAMLLYRGFIRQDPRSKVYRPGTALTGVAFSMLQRYDVRQTLRPCLERIHAGTGELVHLGILDGSMVRFIDAIESSRVLRVAPRVGQLLPANCTSTGKSMLAQLSSEELRRIYPDEQLEVLTVNSVGRRSDLERELDQIRRRGYAVSNEESEEGVASVAAAFPVAHSPTRLAINVAMPSSRLTRAQVGEIGKLLRHAVDEAAPLLH
ncbi:IclR family transcriptional regulator [Mycobacterium intracellulare]|uniref:IclR family transcriptional regulator n=1 Tax=Mycobacterium intracellulare TaxID=1767 RepID=UPI003361492F